MDRTSDREPSEQDDAVRESFRQQTDLFDGEDSVFAIAATRPSPTAWIDPLTPDMRAVDGRLRFAPRLPGGITKLRFRVQYKGRRIRVTVTSTSVAYELLTGGAIEIEHHGAQQLLDGAGLVEPIPPMAAPPRPHQPYGRAPRSHDQHSRS